MAATAHQIHPIPPLYDGSSRILILGSFPSVKSREGLFFYHHPQNRFWRVLAAVLQEELPTSIEEKTHFLHRNHIALWDVIGSCEISGSSDSSIRQVTPNDLAPIFSAAPIQAVFCNGGTAFRYYQTYTQSQTGVKANLLPSTSPANAAWSLDKLTESWRCILPYIRNGFDIPYNFTES